MKKITYQGSQPSGFVQDVDGKTYCYNQHETFEVPADLAKKLITQAPKDFIEAEIVEESCVCPAPKAEQPKKA